MASKSISTRLNALPYLESRREQLRYNLQEFPWWLPAMALIAIATYFQIFTQPSYNQAFNFIKVGLTMTISTTLWAFTAALGIGLVTGLGRISSNVVIKNLATLYVEFIRGIPMLVLIFFIAFVGVPTVVDGFNRLVAAIAGLGAPIPAQFLSGMQSRSIPMNLRAIIALSITYGAFLAEIFRAGIQSIGRGQMEAARSQGMSYWQAMRYIILPQAVRNVMPALGNDFVAMLKDTSLVSVLAVRDITQVAKLYAGHSFRYPEAYTTLTILYLSMTVMLSMLVKLMERRLGRNERR
ncbi:MAG: amino acid ABC transporter permease [Anaerolineaceae bacterium]|nr:amino acid ABC transporter permease [Anaerolineaceae bacterium]